MLVISSRISGWRVTDSITFPKMKPTPMPAPIDPSPAPMPRAIDLRPESVTPDAACASTLIITALLSVTVRGCRLAEVDGRESREDEGLEGGDQADLEQEEDDCDRKREHPERREAQQHPEPAAHEQ